jgi:hypothetical protein
MRYFFSLVWIDTIEDLVKTCLPQTTVSVQMYNGFIGILIYYFDSFSIK